MGDTANGSWTSKELGQFIDSKQCSEISDEQAMDWPLDSTFYFCTECNMSMHIHMSCGYCGVSLCGELDCIKAHASKGCYNASHAVHSQADGNQDAPTDARAKHHIESTLTEPTVDEKAAQPEGLPEGS